MSEEHRPLHIFFFPFLAHGHMIPTIDMAKLFASRGVKSTIITTPLNAPSISKSLSKSPTSTPLPVHILTIDFPLAEFSALQGCENLDSLPSPDLLPDFFKASAMLQRPLEQVFQQSHPLPDCIVADMFFPWATESAAKFGIPRIVFHGNCFFSLCATVCVSIYKPYENVSTDSEPFVIPNLPGDITVTSSQVPDFVKNSGNPVNRLLSACKESEIRSYGVVVNSFYELEKEYADHYRNVLGRRAWHIGPVSLCNTETEEKANRGKETSINEHECLKWLDTKKPKSVVYVCFGSMTNFPDSQLREIAMGLEASGQEFIWVLRKSKNDDSEEWLPTGFEKRMESEGRGLIIRGWAPQMLILEHEAIGVFVTHCGWNSTLEAISAGVVMVTWPLFAEQFYNEKLVTQVLQVGVPIGVKKWSVIGESVKWEAIEKAVKKTMEGDEAEKMRNKAKVLSHKAKEAVKKGGSSYTDLSSLIEGLASPVH